jgi:hypothetical protein
VDEPRARDDGGGRRHEQPAVLADQVRDDAERDAEGDEAGSVGDACRR